MGERGRRGAVAIVGAGIAGLALAVLLARRGIGVTLFERRRDPACGGANRAINFALSRRGLRVFEYLGLTTEVRRAVLPMAGRMSHLATGARHFYPYDLVGDNVIYSVPRAALLQILLSACRKQPGIGFEFGTAIDRIDLAARTLHPRPGAIAAPVPFDHLIGADGANSLVRETIHDHVGRRARTRKTAQGYKELFLPAAAARRLGLALNAFHVWPRCSFMVIALPNRDGSFTATAFMPTGGGTPCFADIDNPARARAFCAAALPDIHAAFPELSDQLAERPAWPVEQVGARCWHVGGRALVIGDAAHAMTPYLGQGMNCALEDCLVFDRLLDSGITDWATLFRSFTKARQADAEAICAMSAVNFHELCASLAGRRHQLVRALEGALQRRHPELFTPKYAMISFSTLPYAEVARRAAIQQDILERLLAGVRRLGDVDMAMADQLIDMRLGTDDRAAMAG